MNKKSFLIVPFFFVNMVNAYSNEEARAAMYAAKMRAEELGSFQKADCIRKQELLFLKWKRTLKQKGSSPEIVKKHFPEIYPIVETGFELHTIESNDYQTLMNFVDATKQLLEEEEQNNRFNEFPPKSKEQSRVFLCNLICDSAFIFFIINKMQQENRDAMVKESEESAEKRQEYINKSIWKFRIGGVVILAVAFGAGMITANIERHK